MNRIVIVGNGFDLSHGLKTSYGDFLSNYLNGAITSSLNSPSGVYNDKLLRVIHNKHILCDEILPLESVEELFTRPYIYAPTGGLIKGNLKSSSTLYIEFHSNFFKQLLKEENWTDIESEYYSYLMLLSLGEAGYNKKEINKFHDEFDELTLHLKNYMNQIDYELEKNTLYPKMNVIKRCYDEVHKSTFLHYFGYPSPKNSKSLEQVLFLNFNYTSLLTKYLENYSSAFKRKTNIINIHGVCNCDDDIIFGYGDDTHPKYKELELLNGDEVLSKMKSFKYPTRYHYTSLIEFIERNVFDVIVVGHSLGISDRVLLKTIFENNNCKMITLLHRESKKNNSRKWIPLSRHFDDKVKMRRKIKDFNDGDIL